MNRYPVHLTYKGETVERKTTAEVLKDRTTLLSIFEQAFKIPPESLRQSHLFWQRAQPSLLGCLYNLQSEQDFQQLSQFHEKNYVSYISLYESMDDILLFDKTKILSFLRSAVDSIE